MFTGIIEELGKILKKENSEGIEWKVSAGFSSELELGDSVSVDGACHTVTDFDQTSFTIFSSKETLKVTGMHTYMEGRMVNLERAARLGDRLDGHLVYGHVDGQSRLLKMDRGAESWIFTFELPSNARGLCIPKGSIAINGVSLTIYSIDLSSFQVMIIPHTFEHTTFSFLKTGDLARIEYDPIAKMVERQMRLQK